MEEVLVVRGQRWAYRNQVVVEVMMMVSEAWGCWVACWLPEGMVQIRPWRAEDDFQPSWDEVMRGMERD
jgi:hypothetical protein